MFMSDFPWLRGSERLKPQYMMYPISTVIPLREQSDVDGAPAGAVVVAKSLQWINSGADLSAFCNQLTHQRALALLIEKACVQELEDLIQSVGQSIDQEIILMVLPENETFETVSEWVRKYEIDLLSDQSYIHFNEELKRMVQKPYNLMGLMDLLAHHVPFPVDLTIGSNFRPIARLNSLGILDWTSLLREKQYEIFSTDDYYITTCSNCVVYILCIDCPKNGPGILIIHPRHNKTVSSKDFAIVRSIVPYLALAITQQNEMLNLQSATRKDMFFALLQDLYQEPLQTRLTAVTVGWEYKLPRYVFVVNYYGKEINHFERVFERYCSESDMCILSTTSKCQKICMLEDEIHTSSMAKVKNYVEELGQNLGEHLPQDTFQIAVSHICHNLAGVLDAYTEAKFALVIGSALEPEKRIFWYSDYMDYHLICSLWRDELMERIYRNVIGRLEKYDEENNLCLLETLESLVKYDFDINEVAKTMVTHRNTIYRRMERIDEIVGEFLDDNNRKLMLQMAVKMRTLSCIYDSMQNNFGWEICSPA